MKRLFLILALFNLFLVDTFPQSEGESHQKIKTAIEKREYLIAVNELEGIARSNRNLFELNNYDYLLARMAEKTGDFGKAMANYQSVVKRNSILKEYALWHLSQIARASGNLMLERVNLQEIAAFGADSLLLAPAKNRLARSWFESKNYDEAIRLLGESQVSPGVKPGDAKATDNRLLRDNLALLARANFYAGSAAKAREGFMELINKQSNPAQPDDFALAAVHGLDLLDGGAEDAKTAPKLSDNDHLQRARVYQFNRDFKNARLHYLAIIQDYPDSPNVADAIYQVGRCYALEGEYTEAINWFERVIEQFPDHPIAKDALSQSASAYSRVSKPKEAITRYQKFIEKYPDDERIERPYLNIVDVLRDQGSDTEALKWIAKTQETFKGKPPEAIALFSRARIRIARSEWPDALADLDRLLTFPDLGGTRVPGGTNTSEVTFLKAYALEQMNRFPEAIDTYLSIPDGRSEYYGWRATERLKALGSNEKASSFIAQKLGAAATAAAASKDPETQRKNAQVALRLTDLADVRSRMLEALKKAYAQLPAYQKVPAFKLVDLGRREVLKKAKEAAPGNLHRAIADELIFLELYDEAAPELEFAKPSQAAPPAPAAPPAAQNTASRDLDYTLAVYFRRGDMANRAVAFAEPLWRPVPADYQIELIPRDQLELLYPAPYAGPLLKFGPERDVDPRLILSIMRQESRYRADVKSYAAARGLMQFISSTSNRIAGELGRKNFRQDDLYDPSVAILFGSQYMADIFKLFPGQAPAVAASYNGGEDNMKRWLTRSQSNLPDRYVPEIVFSQSKDYVYKVMANYRVYSAFYDENLRPR
jgi:soluble lytic murein transglycosylase